MIDSILKYFPGMTPQQKEQFLQLYPLYSFWNMRVNVISRKDTENLYLHHVLHSLSIAMVISFKEGTRILDAGTGGGFPGIPLAILFPEARFHLVDSVGKKIRIVDNIIQEAGINNITTECTRVENLCDQYDFIVSRAVAALPGFLNWCMDKILSGGFNQLENGILYLKGGDLTEELRLIKRPYRIFSIDSYFNESYFREKKIVFIPDVKR